MAKSKFPKITAQPGLSPELERLLEEAKAHVYITESENVWLRKRVAQLEDRIEHLEGLL